MMTALAELFAEIGSEVDAETLAETVCERGTIARTLTVTAAEPPAAIVPSEHVKVVVPRSPERIRARDPRAG